MGGKTVAHANLIAIDDLHLVDERIATELGMMIDYALNMGVQVIATSRVDSNEWPARRLWEVCVPLRVSGLGNLVPLLNHSLTT